MPAATTEFGSGAPVDAGPLFLGLSIHVEGWDDEDRIEAKFDRHVAGVMLVAEVAAAHDAVVTFELSAVFMDAVAAWDSDVVERLHRLGHGTGVHADVGGRGNPSLERLTEDLTSLREKAALIGAGTAHVSGICSPGPWVEAALAAGFTSTNGAVAYCGTSLDPIPEGWDVADCRSPADCHGPPPVDDDLRMHPYRVDSSADFLTIAEDGLVLMIGESGGTVNCAAEGATGGGCVGAADDLHVAAADLEHYLSDRDPTRVAALTMSWSIGSIPDEAFVGAFFSVFTAAVTAGDARWAAMPDIAGAVP